MFAHRFAHLSRALEERLSRRGLGGLAGVAALHLVLSADAKKKKKKRKKKRKPACTPSCNGNVCGPDGCGGSCGPCDGNCVDGQCLTDCFITKWGVFGSGNSQFVDPNGIAVDSAGNVFVADTDNDRIQKFDNNGTFLLKWGGTGTTDGKFRFPGGVAVNAAGEVFVADTANERVQKFSNTGGYLTQWNSDGTPETEFINPEAIATDGSQVFLSTRTDDDDFRGLRKYTSAGAFTARLSSGLAPIHDGLAIHGGTIYGTQYVGGKGIIQVLSPTGELITEWGGDEGSGLGQFIVPTGLAVDAAGNLYVADTGNHRIQVLNSNGEVIDHWGEFGAGDGQFNQPVGVAVDSDGYVFVLDSLNERVQKFAPIAGANRRGRRDKGDR